MSLTSARPSLAPATASVRDSLRVLGGVIAPTVAQGVIARRPLTVALATRAGADDRAVRVMQQMRRRYGPGPLRLRIPGRSLAMVLTEEQIHRVLEGTPEPFAASTTEKHAALSRFQPHGVLVSHGEVREERRRFNEAVLDSGRPLHGLADRFTRVVREEATLVRDEAAAAGVLDWDRFVTAWWRVVRRVVLGDAARHDHDVTDMLATLRSDANWSYLVPKRRALRDRFLERLQDYVDAATPGSLAALVAQTPAPEGVQRVHQIPQWLFAYEPAGMVAYRALALFASHPGGRLRAELAGRDLDTPQELPLLRAGVLESVRLWPTTPALLRETTTGTDWDGTTLPAGTGLFIFAPFFHRDDETVDAADRFDPDQWTDGRARESWSFVPFSAGPGVCPGRELVLFTTSVFLATLFENHDHVPAGRAGLDAGRPLPRSLNPYALRFTPVPVAATP